MAGRRTHETDSGWVGADPDDDLDARLAAEDVAFDLSLPHVMTALGPIDPGALGVTHFGERLLERPADPLAGAVVDPFDAAVAELEDLYSAGVRGVVALDRTSAVGLAPLQPAHAPGANAVRYDDRTSAVGLAPLQRIAAHSLLHIVLVGEGRRPEVVPPVGAVRLRGLDEAAALARLGWPAAMPLLIDAAAVINPDAARAAILRIGGNPGPLTVLDAARLREPVREMLLEAGASLAFNAYGAGHLGESSVEVVAALARAGRADRVVLGSGITAAVGLRAHGGAPGWAGLTERFVLDVMERGVAAADIRAMLVDNPHRQLTMPGRAPGSGSAERA